MDSSRYQAGATRTLLQVESEVARTNGSINPYWVVDKAQVRRLEARGRATVFIAAPDKVALTGQRVFVKILKGYSFRQGSGVLFMASSNAACESGLLVVAEVGAQIEEISYKNRRGSRFHRVTGEGGSGLEDCTSDLDAGKATPI